jgi:hypothetical protein
VQASVRKIYPAGGIEIGTNLDVEYAFYMVDDVWCSSGVPTGLAVA